MIVNWRDKRIIEDGCGGVVYKILDIDNSGLKNVELAMCVFAPKEKAVLHYHKKMEEIYFIVDGEAEIELDNRRYELKNEDSIAVPIGVKHRICNASSRNPLRFLSINSPSWQEDDMIIVE